MESLYNDWSREFANRMITNTKIAICGGSDQCRFNQLPFGFHVRDIHHLHCVQVKGVSWVVTHVAHHSIRSKFASEVLGMLLSSNIQGIPGFTIINTLRALPARNFVDPW